jgi:superfamily II DNA or RNA helicase/HKD family nuclease
MWVEPLEPGLYEVLVTARVEELLANLGDRYDVRSAGLRDAESSDRVSRYVAALVSQAVESLPERGRAEAAIDLASAMLIKLDQLTRSELDLRQDLPSAGGTVLEAVLRRKPDGSAVPMDRPLTPLLDTTILTNARGEPAVAHELAAEIPSADQIDALVAFIRWSGVRSLLPALKAACAEGRSVRVLTSTYTNSTEQRALDELTAAGVEVRVSYDTTLTRLHAKAWLFHRRSGFSTAYIGSSNLTHSAQQTGLEWNVRMSGARNPDVLGKMTAVFDSYWASSDFVPYDPAEFQRRTEVTSGGTLMLSPVEIDLRPFQEEMLDQLNLARHRGEHRNLLVSATGTGKTVMAAVDYARLRPCLARDRLLFVAHRDEILEQSRATFRHALRDAGFGERWVGGDRPAKFDHVFASIQSLNASGISRIEPDHFDVVIVDEFHHAAAPSYKALLERVHPVELLGLTATPERTDGLDVLHFFGGRLAAELRLWDAIDQQYLCAFDYFGIYDGSDLTDVGWTRGRGYDVDQLTQVLTADHVWANRVIAQVSEKITDPTSMRALGFCVGVAHARFMAERFRAVGIPAVAVWGDTPIDERRRALTDLDAGNLAVVFTVDLFNEGVDLPNVDTLLMLRPTDSGTLFLQQLGRGLRKAANKPVCTVLDFVANHRKEFRYDRRYRALLGGSRKYVTEQVESGFPFLPAGCQINLDPVAQEVVLRSIRDAIPSRWNEKCAELRALGQISLIEYLSETGLDLEDVYDGRHSWTEMRRDAGQVAEPLGSLETRLLRAVGRLTHVDDEERIDVYRALAADPVPPDVGRMSPTELRLLRMLLAPITTLSPLATLEAARDEVWQHAHVLTELTELLTVLPSRLTHLSEPIDDGGPSPLRVHARYTRLEILAALGFGEGAKPITWQTGVLWHEQERTDLFAFTLDKSSGGFSPTTRYRDYAISRDLIHWESQSVTSALGETGQRYINHRQRGTRILLFARLNASDRAFWCLGPATYVSHEGERPISFTWKLDYPLPADLYTSFAAAVA